MTSCHRHDAPALELQHVCKTFARPDGTQKTVLHDVNITVHEQQLVTIIGASGCGKSVLLKVLAGLVKQDSGNIYLHGNNISQHKERYGHFAYMPQKDALLPWRTVAQNAMLGAELAGETAHSENLPELLHLFGLHGYGNALPATLSGGMRQRTALLRTYLTKKNILLLDEPFRALDMFTQRSLQTWLVEVHKRTKTTMLCVTHDLDEAILLGNAVLVFSRSRQRVSNIAIPFTTEQRSEEILLHSAFLECKKQLIDAMR